MQQEEQKQYRKLSQENHLFPQYPLLRDMRNLKPQISPVLLHQRNKSNVILPFKTVTNKILIMFLFILKPIFILLIHYLIKMTKIQY